jgi:cytochrome c biogenesis protein CcmG, thiol:disulfide interchange protein DsbE
VRWGWFAAIVLVLGAGWTWQSRVIEAAGAPLVPSPRQGFPAPDFSLPSRDGQMVQLADLRGQVVIINLWASWCVPCRAEMPAIQRVYERHQARGLTVLAVNSTVQDREAEALRFVDELGLEFPVLLDREGVVSRRYLLRALPTTFFVDRAGIIRSVIVGGPMSEAVLVSQVETLLQESR